MPETVAQILCPARSGSSLLNMLLDSLHQVRGLGEITSWTRPASRLNVRNCLQCGTDPCTFWPELHASRMYQQAARAYPDARVLVDASKLPTEYRSAEHPHQVACKRVVAILLVKRPHELVVSYRNHVGRAWTADELAREWCFVWEQIRARLPLYDDVVQVDYQHLAARPYQWRDTLADLLSVDRRARRNWWDSTTHVCGGNMSVHAAKHPARWQAVLEGDRPRYRGRTREIFVDRPWSGDEAAMAAAVEMYTGRQRGRIAALLDWLGLGPIEWQLACMAGDGRAVSALHQLHDEGDAA